jgi:hypothetical protein
MEPYYNPQETRMQQALPNATAVLTLGILSLVLCCCYGIIGVVMAIIALFLAAKDERLYQANPMLFSEGSIKNLRAGKVCAIVGLCLSTLFLLFIIVSLIKFGFNVLTHPELLQERLNQIRNT